MPNNILITPGSSSIQFSGSVSSSINLVVDTTGSLIFSGSNTSASLFQITDATSNYMLVVNGATNISGGLALTGSLSVTGSSVLKGQITTGGPTPTIVSGSGAGKTATISITGSNNGGFISLKTGTVPTASVSIATVTYTSAYPVGSSVIVFPANTGSSALSGAFAPYATGSTTSFSLIAGSSALSASSVYNWNYLVVGY